jgi:hypothetical protein
MSRCVKQFVEKGDVVTVISTHSPRVRSLGIDGDDVRLGLVVAGLASLQHKAVELAWRCAEVRIEITKRAQHSQFNGLRIARIQTDHRSRLWEVQAPGHEPTRVEGETP